MNEQFPDSFEKRAQALFHESVHGLDFALRSRLTQARQAAVEAASTTRAAWFSRIAVLAPAGVTAAAILGAFLWFGSPLSQRAVTVADGRSNFEDMELVASADESSGDAMDMLQDDIEFYDWAEKAANTGPPAA
jgi:hypothetical protein